MSFSPSELMINATPLQLIPPELTPERVYRELKCIASAYLSRENSGHTLQATALVHEALLRLAHEGARRVGNEGVGAVAWQDPSEFLRFAVVAMQRILIEHARHKCSLRRGGRARRHAGLGQGTQRPVLELPATEQTTHTPDQYRRLEEVLDRLERHDERAAMVVRLRFFAGLTIKECGRSIGVSSQTIEADWRFARAFIGRALGWSPADAKMC